MNLRVNRLNGLVLIFAGAALLIVAIDINYSLNAPHPANAQVAGVQLGGVLIPTGTALLLQTIFLVVGLVLAFLGAIIAVFGERGGKRIKRVKEMAECGNCRAPVPEDAQVCPACGAEFT